MNQTMRDRLNAVHPQMLRVDGDPDRKKLADLKAEVGQSVARALEIAGISKQAAAFDMGYADQGVVSRWCAGTERPLFDKLLALDGFEEAWIQARAERNANISVQTVITLRRTA